MKQTCPGCLKEVLILLRDIQGPMLAILCQIVKRNHFSTNLPLEILHKRATKLRLQPKSNFH